MLQEFATEHKTNEFVRQKINATAGQREPLLAIVMCLKRKWCGYVSHHYSRCHELSLPLNRVCTSQSSDSEHARDQWQCAAVTPQVNLSFSFVSCISKHLIECIAIESS